MSVVFIGSYTEMITPDFGGHGEGIYALQLNDQSGELTLLHTTQTVNSGYLVISQNKKYLYAIKEVFEDRKPLVKAYKINKDFSLEFLNEKSIPGSLPCHIEFNNKVVFVSCYGTGNVLRFPLNSKGELLELSHNYKHSGSSINKERQESPHVHQTAIDPNNKHAFVADLGIDKVKAYTISDENMVPNESLDIDIPRGLGPRHLIFNKEGNLAYLSNELTGEISILNKENGILKFHKNVQSLPDSFKETPSTSAIRIHPDKPFLYVANRTLDAITIYKIVKDNLEIIGYQFTQGKTLREFNISPNGKWLIACLQDSDETVIYNIDSKGKLIEKFKTKIIASPVCVAFL